MLRRAFGLVVLLLAVSLGGPSASSAAPRALGSATIVTGSQCGAGSLPTSACYTATLTCPGVSSLTATLKVTDPVGTPSGTLIALNGGGSTAGYEAQALGGAILQAAAIDRGWRAVQVWWAAGTNSQGMWGGSAGPTYGGDSLPDTPVDRACLGATLFQAIHDDARLHVPGAIFAGTGQSGGAAELAYALAWFGLGDTFDCVTFTGGPPIALIRQGCLGSLDPTWASECAGYTGTGGGTCGYTDSLVSAQFLDRVQNDGRTSCAVRAAGGPVDWDAWSLAGNAAITVFAATQISFVFGDSDGSEAPKIGRGWAARITSLGAAPRSVITAAGSSCPHAVPACSAGLTAITATFAGGTYNGVSFTACTAHH